MLSLIGLIPGLLTTLTAYLSKKADAALETHKVDVNGDVAVNASQFQALTALAGLAQQSRENDRSHWWTAWMVPYAFAVFMAQPTAIMLDSLPLLGHIIGSWHIPNLPGSWLSVQQNIILTTCGIGGVGSLMVIGKKLFTK